MLPQATETRGHSKGWSKVMLNLQAVAHADRSFTLIACLLAMFLHVASHESGRGCDAESGLAICSHLSGSSQLFWANSGCLRMGANAPFAKLLAGYVLSRTHDSLL